MAKISTRAKSPISFRLSLADEQELKRIAARCGKSPSQVARAFTSKVINSLVNDGK